MGAKMWKLKTAMSIAKFYAAKRSAEWGGKYYKRLTTGFTESLETNELQQAKLLLESWFNKIRNSDLPFLENLK